MIKYSDSYAKYLTETAFCATFGDFAYFATTTITASIKVYDDSPANTIENVAAGNGVNMLLSYSTVTLQLKNGFITAVTMIDADRIRKGLMNGTAKWFLLQSPGMFSLAGEVGTGHPLVIGHDNIVVKDEIKSIRSFGWRAAE